MIGARWLGSAPPRPGAATWRACDGDRSGSNARRPRGRRTNNQPSGPPCPPRGTRGTWRGAHTPRPGRARKFALRRKRRIPPPSACARAHARSKAQRRSTTGTIRSRAPPVCASLDPLTRHHASSGSMSSGRARSTMPQTRDAYVEKTVKRARETPLTWRSSRTRPARPRRPSHPAR
jgi:hypothetical protein